MKRLSYIEDARCLKVNMFRLFSLLLNRCHIKVMTTDKGGKTLGSQRNQQNEDAL